MTLPIAARPAKMNEPTADCESDAGSDHRSPLIEKGASDG